MTDHAAAIRAAEDRLRVAREDVARLRARLAAELIAARAARARILATHHPA